MERLSAWMTLPAALLAGLLSWKAMEWIISGLNPCYVAAIPGVYVGYKAYKWLDGH